MARHLRPALLWALVVLAVLWFDQPLEALWDRAGDDAPVLWYLATVLTGLVTPAAIAALLLLLTVLDRRVRWRLVIQGAVVMLAQATVCEAVKHLFGRLRPDASGGVTVFTGPSLGDASFSFPSGHAVAAFALAGLLASFYPRWRWLLVALAAAVCVARVQLDRHFPSDVVAGGALGWYVAVCVPAQLRRVHRRRTAPPTADGEASPV